ncbi:MAG: DUF445 domain-containing protein [Spirochaetia bacterium]|nr:DUF445 domain-containing protein [Spirochaetia bacterium]
MEKENQEGNERDSEIPSPELKGDLFYAFLDKWMHRITPKKVEHPPHPEEQEQKFSFILLILKILPYITFLSFLISIWYDFSGSVRFFWSDTEVPLSGLLRMVSVSGLIGFGTNWLAIKMLFYPREKRPILGQGLIPSQKEKIVFKLSHSISDEIINSDLILEQFKKTGFIEKHREKLSSSLHELFSNSEFREDSLDVLQYYVDAFLRSEKVQERIREFIEGIDFQNIQGFEAGVFRIYKMIKGRDMADRVKEIVQSVTFDIRQYEDRMFDYLEKIPLALDTNKEAVENAALKAIVFLIEQVDVKRIILENLQQFDEIRLEKLLLRTTSDQLQYIQYLGCILGILGGFFIWRPVESFIILGTTVFALWMTDMILYSIGKKNSRKAG